MKIKISIWVNRILMGATFICYLLGFFNAVYFIYALDLQFVLGVFQVIYFLILSNFFTRFNRTSVRYFKAYDRLVVVALVAIVSFLLLQEYSSIPYEYSVIEKIVGCIVLIVYPMFVGSYFTYVIESKYIKDA